MAEIKKRYKGNFVREAKKAEKTQARFGLFQPSSFASDIEAINKSLPARCGGPMRPGYLRSAAELRAAYRSEPDERCRVHWSVWLGCFVRNGNDDGSRLVGYLQLRRQGDLCFYSTILGHGGHLHDGIMPFLHTWALKCVDIQADVYMRGLKWLMYGGWNDGRGHGLQLWKKKAGFDPVWFVKL